jgi:hypothetical protein
VMFVVSYEQQLREAFNAGRAAGSAPWIAKQRGGAEVVKNWPKTYEEWIYSIKGRPQIARG